MKVITAPKVHLFSSQEFHPHAEYGIPEDGDEATRIGAFAAKGCYDSFLPLGRPNEANQREVKQHRHGSVFEHVVFGLFVEGVTRGLTLELNRHRQFAISQRSTRYTKEEDAAIVLDPFYSLLWERYGFYMNGEVLKWPRAHGDRPDSEWAEIELISRHIHAAQTAMRQYQNEVEHLMEMNPLELSGFDLRKWARGKARNILPHSLETRASYTGNVRAWRWFIESRSSVHAESEIRRLAYAVWKKLMESAPLYFDDFTEGEVKEGIPELVTTFSKV